MINKLFGQRGVDGIKKANQCSHFSSHNCARPRLCYMMHLPTLKADHKDLFSTLYLLQIITYGQRNEARGAKMEPYSFKLPQSMYLSAVSFHKYHVWIDDTTTQCSAHLSSDWHCHLHLTFIILDPLPSALTLRPDIFALYSALPFL